MSKKSKPGTTAKKVGFGSVPKMTNPPAPPKTTKKN